MISFGAFILYELLALLLGVLFCVIIHFVIKPRVPLLFSKYEPLVFHYKFKAKSKVKKLKKLWRK